MGNQAQLFITASITEKPTNGMEESAVRSNLSYSEHTMHF